jgi:hypothetical protein
MFFEVIARQPTVFFAARRFHPIDRGQLPGFACAISPGQGAGILVARRALRIVPCESGASLSRKQWSEIAGADHSTSRSGSSRRQTSTCCASRSAVLDLPIERFGQARYFAGRLRKLLALLERHGSAECRGTLRDRLSTFFRLCGRFSIGVSRENAQPLASARSKWAAAARGTRPVPVPLAGLMIGLLRLEEL